MLTVNISNKISPGKLYIVYLNSKDLKKTKKNPKTSNNKWQNKNRHFTELSSAPTTFKLLLERLIAEVTLS